MCLAQTKDAATESLICKHRKPSSIQRMPSATKYINEGAAEIAAEEREIANIDRKACFPIT
jgi:hypothetical protein